MARHEGWNTYADGYDRAARDDEREFKRLDVEIVRLRTALNEIKMRTSTYEERWDEWPLVAGVHDVAKRALAQR